MNVKARVASEDVSAWLDRRRAASGLQVRRVGFADCAGWRFRDGRLEHETGSFFSVAGMLFGNTARPDRNNAHVMIDQPEVGWLGFLVRPNGRGIDWLLQAKTEPGNDGGTHIAPTVQATRSNFRMAHGGLPTRYLDLFAPGAPLLSDAPYSEQGTRFLWKFNRNCVRLVQPGEVADPGPDDGWRWFSGRALRQMLDHDFTVNTDARSVIATAPWALLADGGPLFRAAALARSHASGLGQMRSLLAAIAPAGSKPGISWHRVPLDDLPGHALSADALRCAEGTEAVACFDCAARDREVSRWCQPFLMPPAAPAEHDLMMRVEDGAAELFLRRVNEPGFADRVEYGPTFHSELPPPPALSRLFADTPRKTLAVLNQTDEGGRFMQAPARYRIVLVEGTPERRAYPFGAWVRLAALERLLQTPGSCTNELRTLVSMMLGARFDAACADL